MFNKQKYIKQRLNEYSTQAWLQADKHKNSDEYHDKLVENKRREIEAEVEKGYYKYYFRTQFNDTNFLKQLAWTFIGLAVVIGGLGYLWIEHKGMFDRPTTITSSLYSIKLPGKPKETSHTYGSATQAYIVTNYLSTYAGYPSGQQSQFQFNVTDFQGNVNQQNLLDGFNNIVTTDLNQNYLNTSNPILAESIKSQSASTYDGYPAINATLTSDNGNIDSQERFVLVGNVIYWIKATQVSGDNSDLQYYVNTLKFL